MENFHKFWDRINGEMYKNVPPPVKYDFQPYLDSRINSEEGDAELKPLEKEDQARYGHEDVADWYAKYGINNTKLGQQMTDGEFKRFFRPNVVMRAIRCRRNCQTCSHP